jgi:imidazolonepropionase-like amidohydrolase
MNAFIRPGLLVVLASFSLGLSAQTLVVHADVLHTLNGPPIKDAVVVISDGKIVRLGPAVCCTPRS